MKKPIIAISAMDLDSYIGKNNVLIIDLRDEEEYARMHIKGAINLPYEIYETGNFDLPRYREILLYCERGGISMIVAKELAQKGYNVKTMIGGIQAYRGKNTI